MINHADTNTDINQPTPTLVYKVNTGTTSLPYNVEEDLEKYSRVFITKEFDMFRLVHCCEAASRDYKIYGETKERDKKLLFTSSPHFECCNCCEQCLVGLLCVGYACCDSIVFQMDYKRNGEPFYTHGYNIKKGCHCCKICFIPFHSCIPCAGKKLFLRETVDPDSPDIKVGKYKGKTITNCCCACSDKYADYFTVTNLKDQTVRAACCDICKNYCFSCSCCCCNCCVQGCDFEMSIENEHGIKTGNILIYAGCCSKKTEGKMCYFPRSYFEINMPPGATSGQKFQIISDTIHLDLINSII